MLANNFNVMRKYLCGIRNQNFIIESPQMRYIRIITWVQMDTTKFNAVLHASLKSHELLWSIEFPLSNPKPL